MLLSDEQQLLISFAPESRSDLERLIPVLAEAIGPTSSTAFYDAVAAFLASELGVKYVLIGKRMPDDHVQTMTALCDGERVPDIRYALEHTPCAEVMEDGACFFARNSQELFPRDALLVDMGVESYGGIAAKAATGEPLGLVAVLHDRPLSEPEHQRFVELLTLLGDRIAPELERRSYVAAIEDALAEKDTLLREIHHRVKNNMAMASSLIALEASLGTSKSADEVLLETRLRLSTMALLHEHLYRTDNLSSVSVPDYLHGLVSHAAQSFPRCRFTCDLEPAELSIDTLLPLGLIVNELVTNALKYSSGEDVRFEVYFSNGPEGSVLRVRDYGGLQDVAIVERSASLGLQLVRNLCRQLRATPHFVADGGLTVEIRFGRQLGQSDA